MNICVIGGGAAGAVASILLARHGFSVTLFEKNEKIGKKLYITGKGRCNLTNDCDLQTFFENVVHGDKFLRSALNSFTPQDTMAFFEEAGLELVTERGNRVFPSSQKSSDVIKTLERALKNAEVVLKLNCKAEKIEKNGDMFAVTACGRKYCFDKIIIATGGKSYPSTGSTGDGYAFAQAFGHGITEPKQALVPITVKEDIACLQGIALKNVELSAFESSGRKIDSRFGELMFTDRGVSGPVALTLSSFINRRSGVKLALDLKPALDEKKLDLRILRDFEERKNQDVKNVTRALLPDRLNLYVLKRAHIAENTKVNAVTKEERAALVRTVKNLCFEVSGLAPFEQAVITSGGIELKDIKPCGESKLVEGLYFAGETMDVDALTGGFNLQIAFATAAAAAKDIIKKSK